MRYVFAVLVAGLVLAEASAQTCVQVNGVNGPRFGSAFGIGRRAPVVQVFGSYAAAPSCYGSSFAARPSYYPQQSGYAVPFQCGGAPPVVFENVYQLGGAYNGPGVGGYYSAPQPGPQFFNGFR
jgi:hypothetical protein